jgi:hypothetical protein
VCISTVQVMQQGSSCSLCTRWPHSLQVRIGAEVETTQGDIDKRDEMRHVTGSTGRNWRFMERKD